MNKYVATLFFVLLPQLALADGYQAYSTPGTYSFAVPSYGTMSVTVNGAGGGGGGGACGYAYVGTTGGTGGASVFYSNTNMIAYGGAGGQGNYVSGSSCVAGAAGAPGTASGGDTNTSGGGGYGGAGGYETVRGLDTIWGHAGPGGSGGSASKTFSSGSADAPAAGTVITVVIGAGGAGGSSDGYPYNLDGSPGSNGGVSVSWTTPPPPSCSISYNPTTTNPGQSVTVTWTATNATSRSYIVQNASRTVTYGPYTPPSLSGTITTTSAYNDLGAGTWTRTDTVTGSGGTATCSATLVINPPPPPPSCSVTITPSSIPYGSSATLSWSSTNASSFYISSIGYVAGSGSTTVSPGATTNYNGSVSGAGGSGSCSTTLTVGSPPPPPTGSSSITIYLGQSTTIVATVTPGSGDTLTGANIDSPVGTGWASNTSPGTKTITFTPSSTGTYTFYTRGVTRYYSSWATYGQINVLVLPAPQCTISLTPTTISPGQSSTLAYSSQNATSFSINNIGSLTPNTSGSTTVSPSQSTDYTGTVSAGGYSKTCTAPSTNPPGTLTISCNPSYSCSGRTIRYTDVSCNVSNVTTCTPPGFCSPGSATCLYPAPAFNGNGTLTGHLQVVPILVIIGNTVTVNWNLSNVSSCAVTGSNGDSWNGASGKKTSSIITTRTTYTLSCTGLDGSTVQETQTVSVAPTYRER